MPVVMSFGSVNPRPRPPGAPALPPGPDYREQLLAKNWGFATLDTNSVQADNAAGLTQGIIGLVNKGQPRSLEDWGVLRAWGWGAEPGPGLSRHRQAMWIREEGRDLRPFARGQGGPGRARL